ncbi:hypothetical protein KAR91_53970 [Candidatus Pacearchaeota archaeon]|nr:hypothetical protein [Candidatus Pacearchaeota archaeon]
MNFKKGDRVTKPAMGIPFGGTVSDPLEDEEGMTEVVFDADGDTDSEGVRVPTHTLTYELVTLPEAATTGAFLRAGIEDMKKKLAGSGLFDELEED